MSTDDKLSFLDSIATGWAGQPAQALGETDAEFIARVKAAIAPPPTPVMRFRFHRGSLADSMATAQEFTSNIALYAVVHRAVFPGIGFSFPGGDFLRRLHVEPYGAGPDDRIGWQKTYIVTFDGYGVVGFCDRSLDEMPEQS